MPAPTRTRAEVLEWLRTHVRIDDDCRIWAGVTNSPGYPIIWWAGQRWSARMLLLKLLGKPMPDRPIVWSTCGHILCMEPSHLMAGTRRDMLAWMQRQGRFQSGTPRALSSARNRHARMGMRHARAVAQAVAEGRSTAEIAAQYDVHPSAVGHALRRWRRAGVIT